MAFIIGGTAGAIIGAGALGAAGSAVGSAITSGAASDAADQQAAAAHEANQLQEKMYNQTRADNEPWRQAGVSALGGMQNADFSRDFTANDFTKDPGYDFRMNEGQKAIERSAAARGGLQTGGTLKALTQYGQGFASNEYQNAYSRFNADRDRRFGRLSTLAGFGGNANASNASAGASYANNSGANTMGAADAAGAAGMAGANSWAHTLGGIGQNAMDGVWMNKWMSNRGGK
jgi:hypothetical protein